MLYLSMWHHCDVLYKSYFLYYVYQTGFIVCILYEAGTTVYIAFICNWDRHLFYIYKTEATVFSTIKMIAFFILYLFMYMTVHNVACAWAIFLNVWYNFDTPSCHYVQMYIWLAGLWINTCSVQGCFLKKRGQAEKHPI